MRETLHLDLTLQAGHEVRAAKELHSMLPPAKWALLAALAAEIVQEHEARAAGSAVVLVVGADQRERVAAELTKAHSRA